MQRQYNLRNPAVKRLMKEAQELSEPTEQYHAQPLEDNLFEWHFTIRGPGDSEFEGGLYHGRIVLPPEYPMKPPSIILLTPNGRFEVNKKICLSISGYHPESWQPSWSIRTALLAIIGFMPTHGAGAIGSLDYTPQERKVLAKRSQGWQCPSCGDISSVLPQVTEASAETNKEARELASQISFQGEKEKQASESSAKETETAASTAASTQPISSPQVTSASSTSTNQATANPASNSSPSLPSPPPSRFPFPFPPFPAFPVGSPWHNTENNNSQGAAAATTTGPNFGPTFPLPFVAPPFGPMFPPPRHLLSGQPGMFPPGWPLPGGAPGNLPPATSASVSASSPTSTASPMCSSPAPTTQGAAATRTNTTSQGGAPNSEGNQTRAGNSSSPDLTQPPATSSPPDNLRQRHPPSWSPAPPPVVPSSRVSPPQQSGGRVSLFLLTILSIAIGLLLLRRLYMMSDV